MAASVVKIMCTCQAILDAFVLGSKKMATSVAAPGLFDDQGKAVEVCCGKMFYSEWELFVVTFKLFLC